MIQQKMQAPRHILQKWGHGIIDVKIAGVFFQLELSNREKNDEL